MTTATAAKISNSVASVLIVLVPALGPYGPIIELAMTAAETLAPEVYSEIKSLISAITDGHEPTQAEIDLLLAKIAALKNPDGYFKTPPPVTDQAKADSSQSAPFVHPIYG